MKLKHFRQRTIEKLLFLLLVAWIMVLWGGLAESAPTGSPWGAGYFPNVPLINQDGKTLYFYDDVIKDKVVAINFIFTSCENTCPAETAKLRQVQKELGDRVGKDIYMYSISIDPGHDTPEVLKKYREKFNIDQGWQFLTGKQADIDLLRKKLGLFIAEIQDDPTDHNISLIVGNESTGRWMKRSPFDNPKVLAEVLGQQLHNYKIAHPARRSYAAATRIDKFSRGEYLYRTRCSSCHTVGAGNGTGPDLMGVTERRDPAWLSRWLKAPDEVLAEKDPIALELFEQYKQLPMPNLGLNEVDVMAVIEYLKTETQRLTKKRREASSSTQEIPSQS